MRLFHFLPSESDDDATYTAIMTERRNFKTVQPRVNVREPLLRIDRIAQRPGETLKPEDKKIFRITGFAVHEVLLSFQGLI